MAAPSDAGYPPGDPSPPDGVFAYTVRVRGARALLIVENPCAMREVIAINSIATRDARAPDFID